jgi:hypothetical protein
MVAYVDLFETKNDHERKTGTSIPNKLLVCPYILILLHVIYIKSNNSGTAKVKIVKNERDPPLFTSKQLIKF